ncbi:ClpXP protease specificity-enhancing factor [Pasteurellaceae bacterium 22721_9_1]
MEYKSSPKRPYLLQAYYDWLIDNSFTPYLVVDADYPGVLVPQEYVKDGQIVLNISPGAVGGFSLGKQAVEFNARFQGIPRNIYIPMGAALAIYARENGDGVMFEPEAAYDEMNLVPTEQPIGFTDVVDKPKKTSASSTKKNTIASVSHLKIIK